ncbi:hypothetical protein GCM10010339_16320 [Streptomyces alanosinicus]|uniref:Uncharacterized protein n=1 Tax=Streptomyces alanosinicus TaxID=68171 RepID=A0A919D119_9ACTN|nr:hypothetical protein GCM10010339_16320 [Streptomyces alanosinicus]
MAPQAEFLVAGGDSHASVLVVPGSVPDLALALSPVSPLSALSPFSLAQPLPAFPSPPASAAVGHGRSRNL